MTPKPIGSIIARVRERQAHAEQIREKTRESLARRAIIAAWKAEYIERNARSPVQRFFDIVRPRVKPTPESEPQS